jgi:hypothetical protein
VYAVQPIGVAVEGPVGVRINLPRRAGSFAYVDAMQGLVLMVGLDPESLSIAPIGVGRIDKAARQVVSITPLQLARLDYIGISTVFADPAQLQRVVDGQLSLAELTASMEGSEP